MSKSWETIGDKPMNDLMPAILDPKDYERWLAPAQPSHLPVDLLRPYPAEDMKAWKVSNDVGNVRKIDLTENDVGARPRCLLF